MHPVIAAAGFNPLDPTSLLATAGLAGIFLVMVAETGLLIGFFLPGDSLLFAAGLLATSTGSLRLPLSGVLIAAACGALVGAQIGYWIGRTLGTSLLARTSRPALHRGAERAADAMNRYGLRKAIVLARFIPVVRTVMNPMAGMLKVPSRIFVPWQVIGGLLWSVGVTMAGYWIGGRVPNIDHYLLPIVAGIVALSLVPVIVEIVKSRRRRHLDYAPGAERHDPADPARVQPSTVEQPGVGSC
jgi:membrane-associated protein